MARSLFPWATARLDEAGRALRQLMFKRERPPPARMADKQPKQAKPPKAPMTPKQRRRKHDRKQVEAGQQQVNVRVLASDRKAASKLFEILRDHPGARITKITYGKAPKDQAETKFVQVSGWVRKTDAEKVYRWGKVLRERPGSRIASFRTRDLKASTEVLDIQVPPDDPERGAGQPLSDARGQIGIRSVTERGLGNRTGGRAGARQGRVSRGPGNRTRGGAGAGQRRPDRALFRY